MRRALSGLTLLMILSLTACGSLTVQGDVIPAAEATKRQSVALARGELQVTNQTQEEIATPTSTETSQPTEIETPTSALTEPTDQGTGMPVLGWAGFVIGLPAGSQFDDKVDIEQEDIGDFGIKGVDEATEARIISLRDTNQETQFWGRLTCDFADFNNCQLLVERLYVSGIDAPPPADVIDGWMGYIIGNPPGSQFDDYFLLANDDPVHYAYGIESAFSSSEGELGLADKIAALRDSGKAIRIWGDLVCGAIDVGGCQIAVWKIDVDGVIDEIVPVKITP